MPAAVPALFFVLADQPQVGLVDQGGGLERLPRGFPGKLLGGQLAQLVINQRQQLAGGVRVAFGDGVQDLRDLVHGTQPPEERPETGTEPLYCGSMPQARAPVTAASELSAGIGTNLPCGPHSVQHCQKRVGRFAVSGEW